MQIALKSNVPHVARNVWLSGFQMFVLFEVVINEPTFPLSHTLQATCGTLPCNHLVGMVRCFRIPLLSSCLGQTNHFVGNIGGGIGAGQTEDILREGLQFFAILDRADGSGQEVVGGLGIGHVEGGILLD